MTIKTRKPEYRFVCSERELSECIPGDVVPVWLHGIEEDRLFMVYGGETPRGDSFILPAIGNSRIDEWKQGRKYLQFVNEEVPLRRRGIVFDSFHINGPYLHGRDGIITPEYVEKVCLVLKSPLRLKFDLTWRE